MSQVAPKIDPREHQDIVRQALSLAGKYLPLAEQEFRQLESDRTMQALIHLFAKLVQIILVRLNRLPERNFLAFLDLAGVQLPQPRAARAPLQFTLAAGTQKFGLVPAGTQMATAQTEESPAMVFETGQDLTVITPQLATAFSVDPQTDSYADHSIFIAEKLRTPFDIFKGDSQLPHRLYLGHNQVFGFKEPSTVTLHFEIAGGFAPEDAPWRPDQVKWLYFIDEENLEPISSLSIDDSTNGLTTTGDVVLDIETEIFAKTITGIEKQSRALKSWTNNWIIAELDAPVAREDLPAINAITAAITRTPPAPLHLDDARINNLIIDLSKDFFPFGERPKFNDAFYLASRDAFSKRGTRLTITVAFSDGVEKPDTKDLTLQWEFWQGEKWQVLSKVEVGEETGTGQRTVTITSDYNFSDESKGFTEVPTGTDSAAIEFDCPTTIKPLKLNGEENYWLRVRIVDGDYGKEATYREETGTVAGTTVWKYVAATFKPPSLKSFTLTYSYSPGASAVQTCLSFNDFFYRDHSDAIQAVDPNTFTPFVPTDNPAPALYLGFDQNIASLPVTVYFSVLERIVLNLEPGTTQEELPALIWEYWDGSSWNKFDVEDATGNFAERELLRFLAPNDLAQDALFGLHSPAHYWIRTRIENEDERYETPPRLRGVYLNTVWAYNRVTIQDEILGSSAGKPNQIFRLSRTPVFFGQEIMVREPEEPTGEAREEIIKKEGNDAIQPRYDAEGNLVEVWVRWHEVKNFYTSSPTSRDYVFDPITGIVRFGGEGVMIPPTGRNNIKCAKYRIGGGATGNTPAGTINELRSSIPYIDRGTNVEDGEGGGDPGTTQDAEELGPQILKHRDRAVTWEDYEWLVRQASTTIARVKAIAAYDQATAGRVNVIIVPDKDDPRPFPDRALIRQIQTYLDERSLSTLTATASPAIRITGPGYVKTSVETTVVPANIIQAPLVESRIRKNLSLFLHPLKGGPDGNGWDFGRDVFISEIFEIIEDTEGVDHVKSVRLLPAVQINRIVLTPGTLPDGAEDLPVNSAAIATRSDIPAVRVQWLLAEKPVSEGGRVTLVAKGFKEMDEVILSHAGNTMRVNLRNVQQGRLFFEPIKSDFAFPAETTVVSRRDGRVTSVLIEGIDLHQDLADIAVRQLEEEDTITVAPGAAGSFSGEIFRVSEPGNRVYIDENELVYSGAHTIAMESS